MYRLVYGSIDSGTTYRMARQASDGSRRRAVVRFALRSMRMPGSPPTLSVRLGPEGLTALDEIARRRGITRAEAARQAIAETAERERRRGGLAAEARWLMNDETYVNEAREVALLVEQLRGPR
jgi:predicted transcriptional regulator